MRFLAWLAGAVVVGTAGLGCSGAVVLETSSGAAGGGGSGGDTTIGIAGGGGNGTGANGTGANGTGAGGTGGSPGTGGVPGVCGAYAAAPCEGGCGAGEECDPTGHCVVVLATGQSTVAGLAVDASSVYWTTTGTQWGSDGTVMKCAAGGCDNQPTLLAAGLPIPYVITADQTSVYWVDIGNGFMYGPDTAIRKCASQGCGQSPASLFTGIQPEALAVGAGKLFWTSGGAGQDSLWTSAVDGSSPQMLANVDGFALHIAVSPTTLAWTVDAIGGGGSIWVCAPGACSPKLLLSLPAAGLSAVALDAENVYFAADDAVMKCPITGCDGAPTTIVSGLCGLYSIATDGENVYFTQAVMGLGGALLKCPVGGCQGPPTVLAANVKPSLPVGLVVDATSVYWGDPDAGTVMKTAK